MTSEDPRLTAYALGELPAPERDAFERELATDPALQRELPSLIALCDALPRELASDDATLTPDQCAALLAPPPRRSGWPGAVPTAIAASLALLGAIAALQRTEFPSETFVMSPGAPPAAKDLPRSSVTPAYQIADATRPAMKARRENPADENAELEFAMSEATRERQPAEQFMLAPPESSGANEIPSPMASTVGNAAPAPRGATATLGVRSAPLSSETYSPIIGNRFELTTTQPLSTFSIDVDTASYANVRRFLDAGQRPPADAVRLEELVNYFSYQLPAPTGEAPFSVTTEVSRAPWATDHLLARVALKGRELDADALPASNLVFLVDVSGSMQSPDKLPLLQRALRELVARLSPRDRVAIVTYAGNSGLALPSTPGAEKSRILAAIDALRAGGSTNGAAGIELAYATAREFFLRDGNNRVILCTDGDFNVGVTSRDELTALIERERRSGVFLSVLGLGTGNLKDATMERLANRGNGLYAYLDSPAEARKVLVEQMGATLFAIAKDVKIQVEFNPATVAAYRLLGYENRLLAKEDFNDDTKDAGEIGAGHSVTALYELVPAGQSVPNAPTVDALKYQPTAAPSPAAANPASGSSDLFTVKLRFKPPTGDQSERLEVVVGPAVTPLADASADLRFAAAVAAFGMNLRADAADPVVPWDDVQRLARGALGEDPGSYRAEFLRLIEKARVLGPTR